MNYNFFCYDALKKQNVNELFANRFGISNETYERALMDADISDDLLYSLLTKGNKYDKVFTELNGHERSGDMFELQSAILYDKLFHPDEVTFVTTDEELSKKANKYFGDDSIILLKEHN